MTLFVVTAECGLNGHWVVGVFTSREAAERAAAETDEGPAMSFTGFSGTQIAEISTLDAAVSPQGTR